MTFLNSFYIPHYNSFIVPIFFGVPYTLLIVCLMLILVFFLKDIRTKDLAVVLIGLLVTASILFQFIAQWGYETGLMRQMSHKSFEQKKEVLFGSFFNLAYCAQNKLKGRHFQGEFISNMGTSSLVPSIFRYELYPVIDLTSTASHPQARVCLYSDQCTKVPDDFHILCQAQDGYVALRGGANAHNHDPR